MKKITIEFGNTELTVETGRMAKQADASVLVTYGKTAVLTTVVAEKTPKEGIDFLPLTVDYREKTYAAGKIPGGFFKRESRPGDKETLTSRLIDRPIRPLFPKGYNRETQIISLALSADQQNDPDMLAMIGAPTALLISNIPFDTYLTSLRVGLLDGKFILNPTHEQLKGSSIDMIVGGTEDAVIMVECFAKEVPENLILDGIEFAHQNMKPIFDLQHQLVEEIGKTKIFPPEQVINEEIREQVENFARPLLPTIYQATGKFDRKDKIHKIEAALDEKYQENEDEELLKNAQKELSLLIKNEIRKHLLDTGIRIDGRNAKTIRDISTEIDVLPMTHGSSLFTRGETQALVTVTLGTSSDHQRIDDLAGESSKSFMLHYNFPPFSVGEVRFLRGPGRREIGHGMLAERALFPLIPPMTDFPYTIRIVSEILESNGSSSMATVCGSSLALMDAGVPIKSPVAGIAMGLIKDEEKVVILSDILGMEDAIGDMDLKVAGTTEGINAIQMDMKISGISRDILEKALEQAKEGRTFIINKMNETLSNSKTDLSPNAPRIIQLKIKKDKIRDIIGPGGKTIKGIIEKTGAIININDEGIIEIASVNQSKGKEAEKIILSLLEEAEVGKIYLGKVKRVEPYGAFVGILPGIDGLLHISQIADYHVQKIEDELKEGDEVLVKLIEIDKFGRLKLSRKAALKETEDPSNSLNSSSEKSDKHVQKPTRRNQSDDGKSYNKNKNTNSRNFNNKRKETSNHNHRKSSYTQRRRYNDKNGNKKRLQDHKKAPNTYDPNKN